MEEDGGRDSRGRYKDEKNERRKKEARKSEVERERERERGLIPWVLPVKVETRNLREEGEK